MSSRFDIIKPTQDSQNVSSNYQSYLRFLTAKVPQRDQGSMQIAAPKYSNLVSHFVHYAVPSTTSKSINDENTQASKRILSELSSRLVPVIDQFGVEAGVASAADSIIGRCVSDNAHATVQALSDLYYKNIDRPDRAAAIVMLTSRIDSSKVGTLGLLMATAACAHTSPEVVESGIRAIENWEMSSGKDVLRHIRPQPRWLEDYRQAVLAELEAI